MPYTGTPQTLPKDGDGQEQDCITLGGPGLGLGDTRAKLELSLGVMFYL